jgi:hypothetical protein
LAPPHLIAESAGIAGHGDLVFVAFQQCGQHPHVVEIAGADQDKIASFHEAGSFLPEGTVPFEKAKEISDRVTSARIVEGACFLEIQGASPPGRNIPGWSGDPS